MATTQTHHASIQVLVACLSTIALMFTTFSFAGQSSIALQSIYLYQFDMTNVSLAKVLQNNVNVSFAESGLQERYTIGVSGYCGTTNGTTRCHSASGFSITLKSVMKKDMVSFGSSQCKQLVMNYGIHVPESLEYGSASVRPLVIYYALVVGLILCSMSVCLLWLGTALQIYGLFGFGVFASLLSGVSILIAASVAESYGATMATLTDDYGEFGISGSLGNHIFFILIWCSIACQLIVVLVPLFEDKIASVITTMHKNNQAHKSRRSSSTSTLTPDVDRFSLCIDTEKIAGSSECAIEDDDETLSLQTTLSTLVEPVDLGVRQYHGV